MLKISMEAPTTRFYIRQPSEEITFPDDGSHHEN